jgi:hypothetical protein
MRSLACTALLFAACSSSSNQSSAESRLGESCMTNADCKAEVCANQICLPPKPAGDGGITLCNTNADCSAGDNCAVGVCLPPSIATSIPDAGVPSLPDLGLTVPSIPTGFGSTCSPGVPCPGALMCLQGFCIPQLCDVDADCTVGKCVQHFCQ